MKNIPLLVGTLVVTIAAVVGIAVLFSQPEKVVVIGNDILLKENRAEKGAPAATAKVTIVEFSDFQCPACRAVDPLVKQVVAKYPQDVRVIYRHYPLRTIHPNAQAAAEAAEAARSFGKFWEMHDLLFAEQINWDSLSANEFSQKILEYAEKLAIDKTEFQQRINSKEVKDAIALDIQDGDRAGVNSTPSFYINNQLLPAPQQLMQAVDAAVQSSKGGE